MVVERLTEAFVKVVLPFEQFRVNSEVKGFLEALLLLTAGNAPGSGGWKHLLSLVKLVLEQSVALVFAPLSKDNLSSSV